MKSSYLISKDKIKIFLVVDFMEKYFIKLGYKKLKDDPSKIKKNVNPNNFFVKIIKFFKLIKQSEIHWGNPPKKEIVIFDCEDTHSLLQIIDKKKCFILSTRLSNIRKLYLSNKILIRMLLSLFLGKIRINYLSILIEIISPKLVVTKVCHSTDFLPSGAHAMKTFPAQPQIVV